MTIKVEARHLGSEHIGMGFLSYSRIFTTYRPTSYGKKIKEVRVKKNTVFVVLWEEMEKDFVLELKSGDEVTLDDSKPVMLEPSDFRKIKTWLMAHLAGKEMNNADYILAKKLGLIDPDKVKESA